MFLIKRCEVRRRWKISDGRRVGAELAGLPPDSRPTAVFCANDMLALGVLQEVVRGGLRVPRDLAIVGFDDLTWASTSIVPLTTVRQPRELLGRTAVRLLLDEIDQGSAHTHQHVSFAPELIVRESTAPPK